MKSKIPLKETGYFVGDLFVNVQGRLLKIDPFIPETLDDSFLYNKTKEMGDCHLVPIDKKVAEDCTTGIVKLKESLSKSDRYSFHCSKNSVAILKPKGYDNSKHNLFHYLKYSDGKRNFEIIFIRFYKNEADKTVNCILNCLQFCSYIEPIHSIDYYPSSSENGKFYIKGNAMYYNPCCSFCSSVDEILDEFALFINKAKKLDV